MDKSLKYSMKPAEMRTGNNVFNRSRRIIYAHPNDIDLLYYWGVTNYGKFPPYHGIPIDSDRLERLGFELKPDTVTQNGVEYFKATLTGDDFMFTILNEVKSGKLHLYKNFGDHSIAFLKHVIFVHEIQNLVFELTGTMPNLKK